MIRRPLCMVCILFLAVQAVRAGIFQCAEDQRPSALESAVSEGTQLALTGTVSRIEEKNKVTALYLEDNAVSALGQQINEPNILVYINPDQIQKKINIGNVIQVDGEASLFEQARNPGNFDQRSYYQKQGIHVLVWAESLSVRSEQTDRIREFLSGLRAQWKGMLTEHLGEYYGNTMSAILLGEKSGLDAEMKKMYQKNGIGHLLAISGLHMSFIGMGVYGALRRIGLGFVPAGLLGGGVLVLYTLMIGAGVSSLRALIMFLVRIGADMTGRDYDLPTSLSLAAAVICAWQPLYITDAGFQLSFGAILGIWLLNPVFTEMFRCGQMFKCRRKAGAGNASSAFCALKNKLLESVSSSLAVNLFLLGPLLYFYFEVPPYSVILNILVIPVMPLAMGAGLGGLAAGMVLPSAGGAVLQACRAVLWLYDMACSAAGKLPCSRIVTGKPGMAWLAVYYAAIAAVCAVFFFMAEKRRKREREKACIGENVIRPEQRQSGSMKNKGREQTLPDPASLTMRLSGIVLLVFATVMTLLCRGSYTLRSGTEVTVLDVGQGDGIHIRGPEGENFFIDGGSSDVSSVGTYRIEPYLLSCAVEKLDYVFLTHGDEDHINGMAELLEGQELGVRIRNLVLPPEEYLDEKLAGIGRTAARNGTRVVTIEAGQSLRNGDTDLEITCLGPECGTGMGPGNGASLVLGARYGAFGMLLTGDVELEGEQNLVNSGRLGRYPVLKAAHHGSRNSGTEEFLQIVKPAVAVISAGQDNRYGHPHEETLERLKNAGCVICSTQECGAVMLRSDGSSLQIESFLE